MRWPLIGEARDGGECTTGLVVLMPALDLSFDFLQPVTALSRMPLSRAHPFTILTFVIVYLSAITLLGERLTAPLFAGVVLVLSGLVIIANS
jgi:drug/metabolite transporter (DMT)-like permease